MAALHIRPAQPADHPAFARLFPELGVDDPVPDADRFASDIAPRTIVAERDGEVVAYLLFQSLDGEGYVRQLVVAPAARRTGVGRTMLEEVARTLRAAGAGRWCLNVEPRNAAAIALYESFGMRPAYRMAALRFPWTLLDALPPALDDRSPAIAVSPLEPEDDATFELRFDVARGLLPERRRQGYVLAALREAGAPSGIAAFSPGHPGAFPFRVARPGLAGPLLAALRPHAQPDLPLMQVACEDDAELVAALVAAGAKIHLETVHYRGPL